MTGSMNCLITALILSAGKAKAGMVHSVNNNNNNNNDIYTAHFSKRLKCAVSG